MKAVSEQVSEALRLANLGQNPDIQPCILLNCNIDPTQIAEVTSCHVNDSWAGEITKMLEEGFIIFRIQTEFGVIGHSTMAYMAKLKKAE